MKRTIFIAGATGYMGNRLAAELLRRGHVVRGLARAGREGQLPAGCEAVNGNALDGTSYSDQVRPADTFVHLVGTPHPAPWKEREFVNVDLASLREAARSAREARIRHFVYVSVAHPAPVMRAYIRVRRQCEGILRESGLNTTVLRPWYVTGPGHRWPVLLNPLYALAERMPALRAGAMRLGLVSIGEMVSALVWAVENPPLSSRVLEVAEIRAVEHGARPIDEGVPSQESCPGREVS